MNDSKLIYITSIHNGRKTIWEGTVEYLIDNVFGYTLECGHSWDKSINESPKTASALVNALNKSAAACNRCNDYYELSSKEEFDAAEKKQPMHDSIEEENWLGPEHDAYEEMQKREKRMPHYEINIEKMSDEFFDDDMYMAEEARRDNEKMPTGWTSKKKWDEFLAEAEWPYWLDFETILEEYENDPQRVRLVERAEDVEVKDGPEDDALLLHFFDDETKKKHDIKLNGVTISQDRNGTVWRFWNNLQIDGKQFRARLAKFADGFFIGISDDKADGKITQSNLKKGDKIPAEKIDFLVRMLEGEVDGLKKGDEIIFTKGSLEGVRGTVIGVIPVTNKVLISYKQYGSWMKRPFKTELVKKVNDSVNDSADSDRLLAERLVAFGLCSTKKEALSRVKRMSEETKRNLNMTFAKKVKSLFEEDSAKCPECEKEPCECRDEAPKSARITIAVDDEEKLDEIFARHPDVDVELKEQHKDPESESSIIQRYEFFSQSADKLTALIDDIEANESEDTFLTVGVTVRDEEKVSHAKATGEDRVAALKERVEKIESADDIFECEEELDKLFEADLLKRSEHKSLLKKIKAARKELASKR